MKNKLAFIFDQGITAEDVIAKMIKAAENGEISVPKIPDGYENRKGCMKVNLKEVSLKEVSMEFKKYVCNIAILSPFADSIDELAEEIGDRPDLVDWYEKYLKYFKELDPIKDEELISDKQSLEYSIKQAKERIGDTPFAVDLIDRTRRLWQLMAWNAHEVVVRLEKAILAEVYVLHFYGIF